MPIAILGAGAMARYVLQSCAQRGLSVSAQIVRQGKARADADVPQVECVADLPDTTTLLVDCAGHSGLAEHGPDALRRGIDVVTLSIGALADPDISARLDSAAEAGASTLQLASGAIGGLDVLRCAKIGGLDTVTYRGIKPPAGWRGSPAQEVLDLDALPDHAVTHFTGTAREAALRYPKNANVAAAVALAGMGLDDTQVELVADPAAQGNTHEVTARGLFGAMQFSITGVGLPDNPRTSALAAMSAVAAIVERSQKIRF